MTKRKIMTAQFCNYSDLWSQVIIDQAVKLGVTDFYTCPGMRNAPLLRAIQKHPLANIYVSFDERGASYRALGSIKSSGRPAALVCTSGTAVANYLPSVIEAQKTMLPLIVMSADRPGELTSVDANQTINQIEVLRDYTKSFWHLSEPQPGFNLEALAGHLCHHIAQASVAPCGPVHLNIPLREPLDETKEEITQQHHEHAQAILQAPRPKLTTNGDQQCTREQLHKIAAAIKTAKKPLLVFGPLSRTELSYQNDIMNVIEKANVQAYCDVETGVKFSYGTSHHLIPTFDHPEVLSFLNDDVPDLIIHFGHRLTSKHYYNYLCRHQDIQAIHVDNNQFHHDPGYRFSTRLNVCPLHFVKALGDHLSANKENSPNDMWQSFIHKKENVIDEGPLSYPFISKMSVEKLTQAKQFVIGNSTFIRSFDSYINVAGVSNELKVLANRGASGIEGFMAMALGACESQREATVLFLGDVSFIHDLSSLYLLKQYQAQQLPLLIIIANNGGGGIFKLLPIAKDKETLPLLTTPHDHHFHHMLETLGFHATVIQDKQQLLSHYNDWNTSPSLKILEVIISDEDNDQVYKQLRTVKL